MNTKLQIVLGASLFSAGAILGALSYIDYPVAVAITLLIGSVLTEVIVLIVVCVLVSLRAAVLAYALSYFLTVVLSDTNPQIVLTPSTFAMLVLGGLLLAIGIACRMRRYESENSSGLCNRCGAKICPTAGAAANLDAGTSSFRCHCS